MDRGEFRRLLDPLCAMFGRVFDLADWTVYYQALADIPLPLLEAAILAAAREDRAFLPRPGELRALAETARGAYLAAHPWRPCADCLALRGFVETIDGAGIPRLAPCDCRAAHRAALEAAGYPARPMTGDAPTRVADATRWDEVQPIAPTAITQAVKALAEAHAMPRAGVQVDLNSRPVEP